MRSACPLAVGAALPPVVELVQPSAAGSAWRLLVVADAEWSSVVGLMRSWAVGKASVLVAETRGRLDCRGSTDAISVRSMVLCSRMRVFQRTQTWWRCSGSGEITVARAD